MNEQHDHGHCRKWISWSAILVGALVGVGLSFLLNLFSIAIGLSVFTTNKEGMITLALGGLIGLLIGGIAAMFVAGFTAGYLGRPYCYKRNLGVIYGFTTWCLVLILTVGLTSHLGHYVTAYSNFVSHPTIIKITADQAAPTVSTSNASTDSNQPEVTVNVEKATNTMGMGAFIIFVLFFIGALASCFGGHFGMSCRCESECEDEHGSCSIK